MNSVGEPTQQNFCEFREIRGRTDATNHLCKSVKSVGEQTQPSHLCNSVNSVGEQTQPSHLCKSVKSVGDYIPTEPTERTEVSCREESPTDSTDLHRCRRVWHPAVPTQPLTQPTICVDQCNPWENCIPTERTEPTEASCREGPPTDSTNLHRCAWVWHPAVLTQPLTQPNFCEFCGFRGRTNATNHLC